MARTLYLLRHAKASRDDPALDDHDRPLAGRGAKAAPRVGRYMAKHRIAPAVVLCSTARRARDTLALIAPFLPEDTRVECERGLYLAEAEALRLHLAKVDDKVPSVMLVGHNPGLERLARLLCKEGEGDALARLKAKYPTGALAEIALPAGRWRDTAPGAGRLVRFVVPRALA